MFDMEKLRTLNKGWPTPVLFAVRTSVTILHWIKAGFYSPKREKGEVYEKNSCISYVSYHAFYWCWHQHRMWKQQAKAWKFLKKHFSKRWKNLTTKEWTAMWRTGEKVDSLCRHFTWFRVVKSILLNVPVRWVIVSFPQRKKAIRQMWKWSSAMWIARILHLISVWMHFIIWQMEAW